MKKILLSVAVLAALGMVVAGTQDNGKKGKGKKKCCSSKSSCCKKDSTKGAEIRK